MREPLPSRLLFPWAEQRFTYAEYERFLDRLGGREVVPLREFARGAGDLALRHDAAWPPSHVLRPPHGAVLERA